MPLGGKPHLKLADGKSEATVESENPVSPIIGPTNPEGSTLVNPDEASALEIGVSWVYKLKKEELAQELKKFRLDPSGTVDEMRKRLVLFLRVGLASPQPPAGPSPFLFPPGTSKMVPSLVPTSTVTQVTTVPASTPITTFPVPTSVTTVPAPIAVTTVPAPALVNTVPIPAPVTAAAPTVLDPLSIRKWNIHFNGKGDPAAFLERLDEVCTYKNFSHQQLLTVLPELLQDTPLYWYRNNRRFWRTWADFIKDFRVMYFPPYYLEDLEAEIGRRLQRATEPVNTYLTDLQTLIRRHGGMSPEQELRWLYRNLLPDYRQYIKRTDYTDVATLTAKIKEFELLRTEVQQMYSNSHRTETAARLPDNRTTGPNSTNTGTRPTQASRPPVPANRDRPQRPPPEPEPQPSTSRLFTRPSNQATAPTARTTDSRPNVCWRCGETGHYRTQCTGRPKLFCSRCGREGILTRDCSCRQSEN